MYIPCTSAILRFPRRHPFSLLVFIIPFALLVYNVFGVNFPLRFAVLQRGSARPSAKESFSIGVQHPPIDPSVTNHTRILLVSAFYPLANSKHSTREYKRRLSLFLSRIETDVYFFTPPEWEPTIREVRGDLPIHINTTFPTSFHIPPLRGRRADYRRMHSKDREKHHYSPEIYAVWASKPYFLKEGLVNARIATELGPGMEYKYAFWMDAGTLREEHYWDRWPDPARVDDIWVEGARKSGMSAENLIFFPIEGMPHPSMSWWTENMGPIANSVSQGSFFGGMHTAIPWWHDLYYRYHDHWLDNGKFVVKDETLVNALFLLYPSRIIGVWLSDSTDSTPSDVRQTELHPPVGHCVDKRYYYLFFLGSETERAVMADVWLKRWNWMWPWEWVKQLTTSREPCKLIGVLTMERSLKRVLGETWTPPTATLSDGKPS